MGGPEDLIFDAAGNLYVASFNSNSIVRFVSTGGILSRTATAFSTGTIVNPAGMAIDTGGSLYVGNTGGQIWKFAGSGGVLNPAPTLFSTSNLNHPSDLAFDAAGNLYVANGLGGNVLRFATSGGVLSSTSTVFAGGWFVRWGWLSMPRAISTSPISRRTQL